MKQRYDTNHSARKASKHSLLFLSLDLLRYYLAKNCRHHCAVNTMTLSKESNVLKRFETSTERERDKKRVRLLRHRHAMQNQTHIHQCRGQKQKQESGLLRM